MALNATLGDSDANSYITLADADIYFGDRMHSASWSALDDPTKSNLLISSSQMLDWYVTWKGNKTTTTQSMQWPRTGAIRPDGTSIDDDVLPSEVAIATYELAFVNISTDRTEDSALAGLEQVKAGSLMVKADSGDVDSTAKKTIPEQIWKILSDLTSLGGMGIVRLVRG